ncbi:MAG: branched-chain amino acid ABC transporter permease [Chloroflexota bacterium]|jgi:branched-chain amino acid transport system permease protein
MKILRRHSSLLVIMLSVAILAVLPVIDRQQSTRETVFTILRAVALASSLNILLGYTGYISFGHVVYLGFGGYVGFYLLSVQNAPLWAALLAGGFASALLAFLIGKAILRLRGAYFALATIGVNEAVSAFIKNFKPFGGSIGMELNFQVYKDMGGPAAALEFSFWMMVGITFSVVLVSYLIKTSKFGLGLLAIREDEDAAEVIGVAAADAKTWAYVLSAFFPGIIGVLYFFKNGNIEPPTAFQLQTSIEMLVMVMLGGPGMVLGPIFGAVGYQSIRSFLITTPIFKNIQLAISGVILLVFVLFAPTGIIGLICKKAPSLRKVLQ